MIPALLLVWRWARRRGGSHWEHAHRAGPARTCCWSRAPARRRRWRSVASWRWLLTLGCGVGLAGPSWERLPQPVEQRTDALVIVLDLSLSMFAEDVAPSRVVRARQKIADILRQRDEGLTALVAYAGDAHAVVPLTDDAAPSRICCRRCART
jgi:Ca-activated chloride channel homolog